MYSILTTNHPTNKTNKQHPSSEPRIEGKGGETKHDCLPANFVEKISGQFGPVGQMKVSAINKTMSCGIGNSVFELKSLKQHTPWNGIPHHKHTHVSIIVKN